MSHQEVGVARENFVQVGLGVGLLPQLLKVVNGREWGEGGGYLGWAVMSELG